MNPHDSDPAARPSAARPPVGSRRPRRLLAPLAPILLTGVLAACTTVGPDYQAPQLPASQGRWSQPVLPGAEPADLARWWAGLGDPVLERLVETALAQNLDLRQAAARIDEARALRDRAAGAAQPSAGVGASVNRRQQSRNGPLLVDTMPGLDANQTIYDAGFDATWEIDLFGGQRRALESADAQLDMIEAEAQGVRVRIAAEVARTWLTAVGAGHELAAQQDRLATLQHTLELMRRREAAGDASVADVDAAHAQWAQADAALPDIQARQRAAVLGLGVLLGAPPEEELALLESTPAPLTLRSLPVGERADVLRRRPDVLAAERKLAASTADIGVATAELFPKLSIGLGGGFQALGTGNWFDSSSTRFSILPLISWRVFDGGRVRAEIRTREAQQRQAALAYEQAVLAALGDAEHALTEYDARLDALKRTWAALEANRRSFAHAQARYAAGDTTRVDLLSAERRLHESVTSLVRVHTAAGVQLVALYKALGGGWEAPPVALTPTSQPAPPRAIGSAVPADVQPANAAPGARARKLEARQRDRAAGRQSSAYAASGVATR